MAIFAVTYVYGAAEIQAEHRPAHREYLGKKFEEGLLLASGPFTSGDQPGALLLFSADSAETVEDIIAHDPMSLGGAVLSAAIREWNPIIGTIGK